ncbi:MAG: hypothetical protein FWG64_08005 [Firmicutes bacterium]|nr:hypothetical protein [Bacillota bacterium]
MVDKLDSLYNGILELFTSELGNEHRNGTEYTIGKFTGIGFLFPKEDCEKPPLISLKRQKNAVHIYAINLEKYAPIFGKSAVGKGCIRVKSLNNERLQAIKEIISKNKQKLR